jgi:hypothetical protein
MTEPVKTNVYRVAYYHRPTSSEKTLAVVAKTDTEAAAHVHSLDPPVLDKKTGNQIGGNEVQGVTVLLQDVQIAGVKPSEPAEPVEEAPVV